MTALEIDFASPVAASWVEPSAQTAAPVYAIRRARVQELVLKDLAAKSPAAYDRALEAMAYAAEKLEEIDEGGLNPCA